MNTVTSAPGPSTPRGASALRIALALAVLAGLCLWSAPAQAWDGITNWSMIPTETQAGGHPDVSMVMAWDNSEVKNGSSAPPSSPAPATTPAC